MKTEWTQEPHTTVRWAIFEALRGADKASTVDYWDVVTENLIRELKLKQKFSVAPDGNPQSPFNYRFNSLENAQIECRHRQDPGDVPCHVTWHLVSDWKRVDSND